MRRSRPGLYVGGRAARLRLEQRAYRPRGSKAADGAWQVPVCARFEVGAEVGERRALVPPGGADLELPGCRRAVHRPCGHR